MNKFSEYIIYKDVDIYFIDLLYDHNEIDLLKNISKLNKKYRKIIRKKLEDYYDIFDYKDIISKRADKYDLFYKSIRIGKLNVSKYIYKINIKPKIDLHTDHELAFRLGCKYGHLEIAKWIWNISNKTIDLHRDNYCIFQITCQHGHTEIAKWLIDISGNTINIYADDNLAFRWSCENGQIETAKWLHSLDVNINALDNYAFKWSCRNGHLEIVKWLFSISKISIIKFFLDPANYDYIFSNSPWNILQFLKQI